MWVGGVAVSDEPLFCDCFVVTVPEGRSELAVEVDVAAQTLSQSLAVKTLEFAGLRAITAVPGHAFLGAIMGNCVGQSRSRPERRRSLLARALPCTGDDGWPGSF
jgi:hypothetical protein